MLCHHRRFQGMLLAAPGMPSSMHGCMKILESTQPMIRHTMRLLSCKELFAWVVRHSADLQLRCLQPNTTSQGSPAAASSPLNCRPPKARIHRIAAPSQHWRPSFCTGEDCPHDVTVPRGHFKPLESNPSCVKDVSRI